VHTPCDALHLFALNPLTDWTTTPPLKKRCAPCCCRCCCCCCCCCGSIRSLKALTTRQFLDLMTSAQEAVVSTGTPPAWMNETQIFWLPQTQQVGVKTHSPCRPCMSVVLVSKQFDDADSFSSFLPFFCGKSMLPPPAKVKDYQARQSGCHFCCCCAAVHAGRLHQG